MSGTVLVTGGAGYVGSHTAKALAAAGYRAITLDNLSRGFAHAVQWGPLERGDILDRDFLDAVMTRWRPQAVLHFAALAYVGESVSDPARYWRNNVVGSLTLLEAMRDHGVGRIVFSSTCATYGLPVRLPLAEDHPQAPISPYGATKLAVERMLADLDPAHGLRSVALRYFNAAGADPAGELGENHEPETHLIPLAIGAALGTAPRLKIFGTDYPTADGTCIRDYIHVTDLAAAHVAALGYLEAGGASTACNLGTGAGLSVRQIVTEVANVAGRPVPADEGPRRAGDPPELVADPARARQLLGWTPRCSDVASVISTAYAWSTRQRLRNAP
ncbi:MAG: UDP-glucose 4-epimerase GalE [Proteobacteria bacterium]|nr:UDP-glucose 4-epimerase GalE [Pseudomonadota bacterium]